MLRIHGKVSAAACAVSSVAALTLTVASATAIPVAAGPASVAHPALAAPQGAALPFGGTPSAVCSLATPGQAGCLIQVLAPAAAAPQTTVSTPTGLAPSTLKSVYGYSSSMSAGASQTIAIVDAYSDATAASDLATFSAQYGLPGICKSGFSTACFNFAQVSQTGTTTLPATNASWDLEISLDIEWAHALAPQANILLVDATNSTLSNLLAAEQYAATQAKYVSNSLGVSEFSGESADDSYFTRSGVSYFAAAGDSASEMLYPSASPDVISVGGTTLTLTSGATLASETAWGSGGGGCSVYENANAKQITGSLVSCAGKRATPDVALDADPNSGVSVYDSTTYSNLTGWWTVGGTSASTAMWAGVAAAQAAALTPAYVYASPASIPFRDVVSGSNGHLAQVGFDLTTGLGAWSYTPGPPAGLTATSGSSGVTLKWSAPTGAAVTQYAVWRGAASGQETTEVATVTASGSTMSYADAAATGTGSYYYEVQPLNSAGVGPFSAQAQAVPATTPPVASFTKSCSAAVCKFTSTSTDSVGTISAYAWNGGNSVTGTASSLSDTFVAAGTFTVSLKVTNTAGQYSTATGSVICTSKKSGPATTISCA